MYISVRLTKKVLISIFLAIIILICTALTTFGEKESINDSYIEIPIVMYHGILKDKKHQGKYVISTETFEEDLKYLKNNGYTKIFLTELINYVHEDAPLPEKPIILTFDDGYYNNYIYAFNLVKKYDCKMVLSPIGKCTELYSKTEDKNPNYSHCTWNDLSEMLSSGHVEIQNHSYNLHSSSSSCLGAKRKKGENKNTYKKRFTEDIMKMQQLLADNIGSTPNTFTYPFGAKCSYSDEILKEMGFKASLDCEEKINQIHKSPDSLYGLHRFLRPPNTSSETFFNKINKN